MRDVHSDVETFQQNLIFSATVIKDQDIAIDMMKFLIESGVDPTQKDNLKQSSIYYAARDGKLKVI